MSLNHICLMGRLVRDPELRHTGNNTAVTNFTLAVDRDFAPKDGGEKKADFINCVAWRQTGEFVAKHLTKGRMVTVSGRLEMRDWIDKDENKRTAAEVIVDNVYFADSKKDGGDGNAANTTSNATTPAPAYVAPVAANNDDGLPF